MRKQLLIIAVGLSVTALAQPTLTSSNIAPAVGKTVTTHPGNYVSPGNAGANQTWNLSFTPTTGASYSYVSPSSTPNGTSFPGNTVAMSNSSATAYYNLTSTAFQFGGTAAGGVVMPYSNKEDFLRFPFTYNQSYTDTWAATFTNGITFYRSGSTTVTYDGYGTLTTPAGTFSNVVRAHFVQTYQDSSSFGIITYSNDQYMWWLPGYHNVIATIYNLTSSMSSTPTQGGQYDSNISVGVSEIAAPQILDIFPVPANDKVTFTVNKSNDITAVKVFSLSGAEVKNFTPEDLFGSNDVAEIPVADLPQGIYFVQIRKGNAVSTKKIVISR